MDDNVSNRSSDYCINPKTVLNIVIHLLYDLLLIKITLIRIVSHYRLGGAICDACTGRCWNGAGGLGRFGRFVPDCPGPTTGLPAGAGPAFGARIPGAAE